MVIFRVQIGGGVFIRAWAFIRDFTVHHHLNELMMITGMIFGSEFQL